MGLSWHMRFKGLRLISRCQQRGHRRGHRRSTLIITAQLSVATVAVVALIGMVTRNPFWLLGFSFMQGLLFLALAFYLVVVDGALVSSRATTCVSCDGRALANIRSRKAS